MHNDETPTNVVGVALIIIILTLIIFSFYSCTISFTNISTHGQADDLYDEDQSPKNDVNPNLNFPLIR